MHSVRSLFLITSAILGFAVLAPPASAAFAPLALAKVCSPPPALPNIPSDCTITASNIESKIPLGTKVFYYGPRPGGFPPFVSSSVVLDAGFGSTASGYCMVGHTLGPGGVPVGYCAFDKGSGTMAGFQAVVKVTADFTTTPVTWHWDGEHGP